MIDREAAFNGLRHDYGSRRGGSQWREQAPTGPTLADKIAAAYKPKHDSKPAEILPSGPGRPNPVARARMTKTQTVDAAILAHLRNLKRNDGWVAVTRAEWAEALEVDVNQVRNALDRLKRRGLIESDKSLGVRRLMWRATTTRIRDEDV